MALVVALIAVRSFPVMRGAARIAHMPKCDLSSSADIPRPTSSMSGSFQCPGLAYFSRDNLVFTSMMPVNEVQLALMSKAMRHKLASCGQLTSHGQAWRHTFG